MSPSLRVVAAAFAVGLVLACGGGGGGGGGTINPNNGVTLNLTSASLAFGQTLNLTGTVQGEANQVILWSADGGTVSPTGPSSATYTAPNSAGTFRITARADANAAKTGTCTVTVSSVGISIDPPAVTLAPSGTTSFNAVVVGAANTNATFTATGGTLTPTGPHSVTYKAPAALGNYTVTAKSVANSSKTSTATVTVANVGSSATVTGKVVVEGTLSGVQNIVVAFYNSAGSEVARGTTSASGNFSAQVPVSAKRLHVLAGSISDSYYKAYAYAGKRYAPLVPTCTAPIPTLVAGSNVNLPSVIEIPSASDPPPPPPNGCG